MDGRMETLQDFGYYFNKEGVLKNIDGSGNGFVFQIYHSDKDNQRRYERLGEVINNHMFKLLEEQAKLLRINMPVDDKKGGKSFIFASPGYKEGEKLLLLVHGSGVVRAGQWSRRLIINNSLKEGSQLPYIEKAKELGYEVLVLNSNLNYDTRGKKIFGSENPERHFGYVWKHFVERSKAKYVAIIAHSYGGVITVEQAYRNPGMRKRVFGVAFTDSVHGYMQSKRGGNTEVKDWMNERVRNWVSSSQALDEPLTSHPDDCVRVSAGTPVHEETSWKAFVSVWRFLEEKLQDRVNPPQKATKKNGLKKPSASMAQKDDHGQVRNIKKVCKDQTNVTVSEGASSPSGVVQKSDDKSIAEANIPGSKQNDAVESIDRKPSKETNISGNNPNDVVEKTGDKSSAEANISENNPNDVVEKTGDKSSSEANISENNSNDVVEKAGDKSSAKDNFSEKNPNDVVEKTGDKSSSEANISENNSNDVVEKAGDKSSAKANFSENNPNDVVEKAGDKSSAKAIISENMQIDVVENIDDKSSVKAIISENKQNDVVENIDDKSSEEAIISENKQNDVVENIDDKSSAKAIISENKRNDVAENINDKSSEEANISENKQNDVVENIDDKSSEEANISENKQNDVVDKSSVETNISENKKNDVVEDLDGESGEKDKIAENRRHKVVESGADLRENITEERTEHAQTKIFDDSHSAMDVDDEPTSLPELDDHEAIEIDRHVETTDVDKVGSQSTEYNEGTGHAEEESSQSMECDEGTADNFMKESGTESSDKKEVENKEEVEATKGKDGLGKQEL